MKHSAVVKVGDNQKVITWRNQRQFDRRYKRLVKWLEKQRKDKRK